MTMTRVSSKPTSPEAVLAHVEPGADIVMPNANGEPVELVNTLEEHAEELSLDPPPGLSPEACRNSRSAL
jgi:hypothetical protein